MRCLAYHRCRLKHLVELGLIFHGVLCENVDDEGVRCRFGQEEKRIEKNVFEDEAESWKMNGVVRICVLVECV